MITEFQFWLESIVEDFPIPYEVKHICFVYEKHNNAFVLSMGGCELKPNINNIFDYYPLEAQFFFDKTINNIKTQNEDYYAKIVKTVIDESFSSDYLKIQFDDKSIYFGEYGNKLDFLFTIKNNWLYWFDFPLKFVKIKFGEYNGNFKRIQSIG